MKLLICIDQDNQSEDLARFGGQLASALAKEVTLLHVQPAGKALAGAEDRLAKLRSLISYDPVTLRIRQGTAVTEIFDECQTGEYDMILVGSPTVAGFLGHIFPSVAQTVAEKAPVSVIVAKAPINKLQDLLVCSSGLLINQPVITAAAQLAASCQAKATLLHIAEPIPQMYKGLNTMAETLDELLASETPIAQQLQWALNAFSDANIPTNIILRHGLVIDQIIAESNSTDYDLVVLGAPQQHTLWQSLFIGKVAPRVIEQASCAVMLVRS